MGMYTELNIGIELKENTPQEVIDTITKCINNEESAPEWRWALSLCGSYYFDGKPCRRWEYDKISHAWYLTIRNNIKNYGSEIEKCLEFLAPHIETDGFIGTYRYEEDEHPTLLYAKLGKVVKIRPKVEEDHEAWSY